MFDLSTAGSVIQREDQGRVVKLKDEAQVPYDPPVTVTVVGTYSRKYKQAMETRAQAARKRRMSDEDAQREVLEATAECVIAWEGFSDNGAPMECKPSNVVKVLEKAPWIHEQIAEAMHDHAGFSKAASPS